MDFEELSKREPIANGMVSVCLPTWILDESQNQRLVALCNSLDKQNREYEVIIASDSFDKKLIAPNLTKVRGVRSGPEYGECLSACIRHSQGAMVLEIDPDVKNAVDSLSDLFDAIDRCDIVWGSCNPTTGPVTRILLKFVYALPMKDPVGGLNLYRRGTIKKFPIQSVGRFARLELVAKSTFCTCLIDEVSLPTKTMGDSRKRDSHFWNDFRNLFGRPKFVEA